MKRQFIDSVIKGLATTGKKYSVGDQDRQGLRVVVTPAGVKSFVYSYRSPATGKTRDYNIGQYPAVKLADAIAAWKKSFGQVSLGKDPQAERLEVREEKKARSRSMNASHCSSGTI
jgi:hypothetical protein